MALEVGSIWVMTLKNHKNNGKKYEITSAKGSNYTLVCVSDSTYTYSLDGSNIKKYFKRINKNYWEV